MENEEVRLNIDEGLFNIKGVKEAYEEVLGAEVGSMQRVEAMTKLLGIVKKDKEEKELLNYKRQEKAIARHLGIDEMYEDSIIMSILEKLTMKERVILFDYILMGVNGMKAERFKNYLSRPPLNK